MSFIITWGFFFFFFSLFFMKSFGTSKQVLVRIILTSFPFSYRNLPIVITRWLDLAIRCHLNKVHIIVKLIGPMESYINQINVPTAWAWKILKGIRLEKKETSDGIYWRGAMQTRRIWVLLWRIVPSSLTHLHISSSWH